MKKYCCDNFRHFATYKCDQHANPYECYDYVIVYDTLRRQYGLIVYDLGVATFSYIVINHCPWCGAQLYKKLHQVHRMLDFGALAKFGSPDDEKVITAGSDEAVTEKQESTS